MSPVSLRDVSFLELHGAVLCVQCELISYNNTDRCLACGSRSILSMSRVLGGSLQCRPSSGDLPEDLLQHAATDVLGQSLISAVSERAAPPAAALRAVVERAQTLTGADGAALAIRHDTGDFICTAQVGNAPDLGAHVPLHSGISALCLRTGRTQRSGDTRSDRRADRHRCRDLSARSVVAAPLLHLDRVFGLLEVLSSEPSAFDDTQVATVQFLASLALLILMRGPSGAPEAGALTWPNPHAQLVEGSNPCDSASRSLK